MTRLQLPDAVEAYFRISNGGDLAQVAECFCSDATVIDENKTHRGLDAITVWQREARQAFTYRVEPVDATGAENGLTVTARVVGDFPGSPALLNHVFVLRDGRIDSLEIH